MWGMETFVVRIWQPADEVSVGELHGTVEYVRGAGARTFSGRDELVDIIEAQLAEAQR